eukprot:5228546-Prymnesium_polylepis.4
MEDDTFADLSPLFRGIDFDKLPHFHELVEFSLDTGECEDGAPMYEFVAKGAQRPLARRGQHCRQTDDLIAELYIEHGPAWRLIRGRVADRTGINMTSDAIRNRYIRMCGMGGGRGRAAGSRAVWTKEEDEVLTREWESGASWACVAKLLVGRNGHACRNRAFRLSEMSG